MLPYLTLTRPRHAASLRRLNFTQVGPNAQANGAVNSRPSWGKNVRPNRHLGMRQTGGDLPYPK